MKTLFKNLALGVSGLFMTACQGDLPQSVELPALIPLPNEVTQQDGAIELQAQLQLSKDEYFNQDIADRFIHTLEQGSKSTFTGDQSGLSILLDLNSALTSEAYTLNIDEEGIRIEAADPAGIHYAAQTINQLMIIEEDRILLPKVSIKDAPRFAWRGMHLDVSRHFYTKEEVMGIIDEMAALKLNKFHMHLTDDEGWRIEIKKYPKLTAIGAWRDHEDRNGKAFRIDSICKVRSAEDPNYLIPDHYYKEVDGKKLYGGFYTQEDIKELVAYAADRHIEIIPEIDVPGHFKAAIDNYPYLSCSGKAGWGKTFSYPACLGKESSVEFIKDVLGEVSELFPSKYLHIGGDEVNKDEWKKCKHCQAKIAHKGLKDEHELQSDLNRDLQKYLHSKGKKMLGWDEITEGGLNEGMTVMWWRNWAPKARYKTVDNNCDLILSPDFELYFDFTYKATPMKKSYEYEAIPEDFNEEQSARVLGIQGNIWTEYMPNIKRLQHMYSPRIYALAEAAWIQKEKKNWDDFSQRLLPYYDKMEQDGIFYHLPAVEGLSASSVFIDKDLLKVSAPLKGTEIRYTLDGSTPDQNSALYEAPVKIEESCKARVRMYRGEVFSDIYEGEFKKEVPAQGQQLKATENGVFLQVKEERFKKAEQMELTTTSSAGQLELGVLKDKTNYGACFKGYFKADQEGVYVFDLGSDAGSVLYINGNLIVNNDGNHLYRVKSGEVALGEGFHEIELRYRNLGSEAELSLEHGIKGHKKQSTTATLYRTK